MADLDGHSNGANGVNGLDAGFPPPRYSRIPATLTVTVPEEGGAIDIEIPLDEDIQDDPTELCTLLENEHSAKQTWTTVAIAYAKHSKGDVSVNVLRQAVEVFASQRADDRLSILNCLCWMYLLQCREAPRIKPDGADADVQTKEMYLQQATSCMNDASRINPSYPPLFLARGVLLLLRASLQAPATTAGPNQMSSERVETLKQANKCFEDALRHSGGKNLMAKMGKARVHYSMGKYAEALKAYQNVLESSPTLTDPDPRIGIGCCSWQLGFKDDAAAAWDRALALNPKSKIALTLRGIYNFHLTSQLPPSDPSFLEKAKEAMTKYIAPSFQQDNKFPLTCATLGSWYIARKQMDKAEVLSRRAIELTDVNAIASDGWYQLARKEHQEGNGAKVSECYSKSDQARGGDDRGYIPAKFGAAQMRVIAQDHDGAKYRLEKILQQQPSTLEAQTLLGTLYAEDVFNTQKSQDEKSAELKKALKYLEDVQKAWKDPKKKISPDQSVLLNLARLYESEQPEKSLKCLEEVEQMEIDAIPEDEYPEEYTDETQLKMKLRELLPPQLLNNIGCFHYQADRYVRARDYFQAGMNACVHVMTKDETSDGDALVTSISYNLGRTFEEEGMLDEAKGIYERLLTRRPDYIDARTRLAYIALQQSPTDEGPKSVTALFKDHSNDLEVRALFGWYTNKSKRKTNKFNEDMEQKHYKHTLQQANKHDKYSLIGMGNIYLTIARESRRDTEADKKSRRWMYERAVEFFDKVLQLDPKNAYAAQGIAIALVEDKKDFSTALQIFTKIKDTLKTRSIFMNLGHTYCEIKQYSRAIENYEAALAKDSTPDPTTLACLGRVWFMRGKQEVNLEALKTALEYSRQAVKAAPPGQVYLEFNIAFVQFQIAQVIHNLPDSQRTMEDVQAAADGLEEAIVSFDSIANSSNPPFPKNDIIQRASMARNTMRNQLARAVERQAKYEEQNASKLQQAREQREAEIRRREEEKRKLEEAEAERNRKIKEEQERLAERDREHMEKRAEEERRRQELIDDSELRKSERKARGKGSKRKKKTEEESESEAGSDDEGRSRRRRTSASGTEGLTDGEERPRAKKRKLTKKSKSKPEPAGKYKSADFVHDSDSEGEADLPAGEEKEQALDDVPTPPGPTQEPSEDEDEDVAAPAHSGRKTARVVDEDDEDEDDEGNAPAPKTNGDVDMDDDEDE